jgi:hypothetical protein
VQPAVSVSVRVDDWQPPAPSQANVVTWRVRVPVTSQGLA